jgi:hypothetical protein
VDRLAKPDLIVPGDMTIADIKLFLSKKLSHEPKDDFEVSSRLFVWLLVNRNYSHFAIMIATTDPHAKGRDSDCPGRKVDNVRDREKEA